MRSETNQMERDQMSKFGHLMTNDDWYEEAVEEIKQTITEGVFASNWALIETYWAVGKKIKECSDRQPLEELVQHLALDLNKSRRTLFYAYKFYSKFPDLNMLPEGKNSRWYQIIQKYLTEGEEKLLHEHEVEPKPEVDDLWTGYITKARATKSQRITIEFEGEKWTLSKVVEKKVSENGVVINQLIELFEAVNPSFEQLFRRPAERTATERLLLKHGEEFVRKIITVLPQIIGQKYAPRVTTPQQLEMKLGELRAFIAQNKGGSNGRVRKIR